MNLYSIIATWFFSGYFKYASGTFGSLMTYPLYIGILYVMEKFSLSQIYFYVIIVLISLIGYFSIVEFEKVKGEHDSSEIVIDEVIGMLVTIALSTKWIELFLKNVFHIVQQNYLVNCIFILSFIVFRFFDILKPYPIYIIDNMKAPSSAIMDDVVAAIFSALVFYLLTFL